MFIHLVTALIKTKFVASNLLLQRQGNFTVSSSAFQVNKFRTRTLDPNDKICDTPHSTVNPYLYRDCTLPSRPSLVMVYRCKRELLMFTFVDVLSAGSQV